MIGGNLAVDLAALGSKMTGVEVIDITGIGANRISLDFASAVKELGVNRSGQVLTLTLLGDENDDVYLLASDVDWIYHGASGQEGFSYVRAYGDFGAFSDLELVVRIGFPMRTLEFQ